MGWPPIGLRTVNPKRPKIEPIGQPTLFQKEKLDSAAELMGQRPFSLLRTNIFLGTSAFTATGWEGSFYGHDIRTGYVRP
jgi:hypothetical protein